MSEEEQQYNEEEDIQEHEEGEEFDPENMDEEQLRAYYAMNGIELPQEFEDGEEDMEEDEEDGGEEYEEEEQGQEEYEQQNENEEDDRQHQYQSQKYEQSPYNRQGGESPHSGSEDNSFTSDPDQMRVVRRDLLENLNKVRKEKKLCNLYVDLMTNQVAMDYAQYLNGNAHDLGFFKQLYSQQIYQFNRVEQHRNDGECHLTYIVAKYEEDIEVNKDITYNYFMEMGYLFLEVETDRKFLLDSQMNHIGLGVAASESHVVIVQILSRKVLAITKIQDGPAQTIQVIGRMLDDKVGIYAIRLYFHEAKTDHKIGPEMIDFDRQTREFVATIEAPENCNGMNRKLIECFVRNNPDSIPYKKQTRDKLNLKHVDLILRIPVFVYPDPRYAQEDELARAKKIEIEEKEMEEEEKRKTQDITHKPKKGDRNLESGGNDEGSQRSLLSDDKDKSQEDQDAQDDDNNNNNNNKKDDYQPQRKFEIPKEQQISNKEIREELEIAIAEAQRQHDELYDHNLQLQQQIKMLRNRQEVYVDKTGEMAMNEHKYLNTLAHVHQIRLDLKQTQDRYNKMAYELQTKLEEKQKKCNEIKLAFMELKREVARKAAFSRTDKPIPEKQIDEWEERELDKNKILQELRLDILRLRNTLAKNQKILKKKEELAEGLHLIDFEQLKIENQTLNEKIEERNEDLHKLKNKNTKTVQILTHTKEKLGFVKCKYEDLQKGNSVKETELNSLRESLSDLKKTKDKLRASNLRLKQQTGIVNSQELIQDYHGRKQRIVKLKSEKNTLFEQLSQMHSTISQYNFLLKASQTVNPKVKQF